MAEEILIDADSMTLERVERYFAQRRERMERGKSSTQDWFLDMFCQLLKSQDEEDVETTSQPDDVWQALRLITSRLDALDRKMPSPKEHTPRTMQLAKARCQAVAKYLWQLHPDMNREEMAQHDAIFNLSITDGKRYTPKTIKKWIADVDPRPAEKKRGRPRKTKK